jgi:hypothetical protein
VGAGAAAATGTGAAATGTGAAAAAARTAASGSERMLRVSHAQGFENSTSERTVVPCPGECCRRGSAGVGMWCVVGYGRQYTAAAIGCLKAIRRWDGHGVHILCSVILGSGTDTITLSKGKEHGRPRVAADRARDGVCQYWYYLQTQFPEVKALALQNSRRHSICTPECHVSSVASEMLDCWPFTLLQSAVPCTADSAFCTAAYCRCPCCCCSVYTRLGIHRQWELHSLL